MKNKPFKRRLYSILTWVGWALLVQFVLINICAAFYAHKLTHFYDHLPPRDPESSENVFSKSWRLFTGPKYPKSVVSDQPTFPYDTVKLQTGKLTIDAWYARNDSTYKGVVVLFHGIGGNKGMLIDEANEFRYEGYDVMLVDFRAHGNSDGNTTTIGYREANDVKLCFDYLQQKGKKNIFLYGSSMGAVAVARSVAENHLQPAGIILEMPFQSLHTYLRGKARNLGFPGEPFAAFTTFWIGVERGFNAYRHSTVRYAKQITCPVLMQWGTLDHLVLENETKNIFSAIASPDKRLVIYDGAQHESLVRKDPPKWRTEISSFLEKHLVQ